MTAGTRTWAASVQDNRRPGSLSSRWMAVLRYRCRRRVSRTGFLAAAPSSSSVVIHFCAPHRRLSASVSLRGRARHPPQTESVSDLFFVARVRLPFYRPDRPRTCAQWCAEQNSTSSTSHHVAVHHGVLRSNLLLLFDFSLFNFETYVKCFHTDIAVTKYIKITLWIIM